MSAVPEPPPGAGPAGRKLWAAITADYDLEEHELVILARACRVADVCAQLQAVVDREGLLTETRLGETRAHPALVELRQESITLTRLLVALRVPLGEQSDDGPTRTQYRGPRGVYGLRAVQ